MIDGNRGRRRRKTVWIVLAVLALFCCGVPGTVGGFFIREDQIDKEEAILKVRDDDPIEVRSVHDLLKAYGADKAVAEAKYDRRVFRVAGRVSEISKKHLKIVDGGWVCHFDHPGVPFSRRRKRGDRQGLVPRHALRGRLHREGGAAPLPTAVREMRQRGPTNSKSGSPKVLCAALRQ